jgi:polyisoprenoid-binding protein YceI
MNLTTTSLALLTITAGSVSAADSYQIDGAHTAAVFKISHLGFSNTWGRFNGVSGSVVWDDANLEGSSVAVTIATASVDTGVAKKDEHLRSGDFFSVKEFPEMTFVSKSIAAKGDNLYDVTGDFTLHGVTKTITIPVTKMKEDADPMGKGRRIGFDTEFTIVRSEFGVSYGTPNIGDEVTIIFSTEATKP